MEIRNKDLLGNKRDEINCILEKLDKDISVLENQKKLIENLEIKSVDIDMWGLINETPLRNSKILLDILSETFPDGDYFKLNPNSVHFTLHDIDIKVPTCRDKRVYIDLSWYAKPNYKPITINKHKYMRKYFNLLESGDYSWIDLAKIRHSKGFNCLKLELFLWWNLYGRYKKVDIEKWQNTFKKEDELNKEILNKYIEKANKSNEKLKILKNKVIPIVSEFSEVKGILNGNYISENDMYSLEFYNVKELYDEKY